MHTPEDTTTQGFKVGRVPQPKNCMPAWTTQQDSVSEKKLIKTKLKGYTLIKDDNCMNYFNDYLKQTSWFLASQSGFP